MQKVIQMSQHGALHAEASGPFPVQSFLRAAGENAIVSDRAIRAVEERRLSHRADIPCIQTVYGRLPAFGNAGECRDIHPALYTGIRITG